MNRCRSGAGGCALQSILLFPIIAASAAATRFSRLSTPAPTPNHPRSSDPLIRFAPRMPRSVLNYCVPPQPASLSRTRHIARGVAKPFTFISIRTAHPQTTSFDIVAKSLGVYPVTSSMTKMALSRVHSKRLNLIRHFNKGRQPQDQAVLRTLCARQGGGTL